MCFIEENKLRLGEDEWEKCVVCRYKNGYKPILQCAHNLTCVVKWNTASCHMFLKMACVFSVIAGKRCSAEIKR